MSIVFWGVDIETTGTVFETARTIQLGIAAGLVDGFVSDCRPLDWPQPVEPEAMTINGFTEERIERAPSVAAVDVAAFEWCKSRLRENQRVVAVGWNVAGFDLPFIRRELPRFAERLSYRTVDLNAICFALDGKGGHNWEWHKKRVKKDVEAMLGAPRWHDAGYDATAALLAFSLLKWEVRG